MQRQSRVVGPMEQGQDMQVSPLAHRTHAHQSTYAHVLSCTMQLPPTRVLFQRSYCADRRLRLLPHPYLTKPCYSGWVLLVRDGCCFKLAARLLVRWGGSGRGWRRKTLVKHVVSGAGVWWGKSTTWQVGDCTKLLVVPLATLVVSLVAIKEVVPEVAVPKGGWPAAKSNNTKHHRVGLKRQDVLYYCF